MNWGIIAGLALTRLVGMRLRPVQQRAALACAVVVLWAFVDAGSAQLKRARRQGVRPMGEATRVVQISAGAILEDMRRRNVQRPLFHMRTPDWAAAAGVLLQVYKRGRPPAVEGDLVLLFGGPLAARGDEDRLFVIADAATHAAVIKEPGDEYLGNVRDIYIHAKPVASESTRPAKRSF